jgi:hypothetical protein
MLQTTTTTYESHLLSPSSGRPEGARAAEARAWRQEVAVDEALAESFPASDPPSWTPGIARPVAPGGSRSPAGLRAAKPDEARGGTSGQIDESPPDRPARTLVQALISLASAGGVALLVPVGILLVGMPVALAVRGLLEVFEWLAAAWGG